MEAAVPQRSPRLLRIQIVSLGLLVVTGALNYLDRAALSIANPAIREEMGLSLGMMGVLLSAFSWSYAVAQLPVGHLVDRYRPRLMLTIGVVAWSAAQAACGFVKTFTHFIIARIALGIGESPQFPTAARVVSDWFPVNKRGFPTGIFNSASPLGTAIAPPLLSVLLVMWGWREMFIVLGVAGFAIAAVWWFAYRNPRDVALTQAERTYIEHGATHTDTPTKGFDAWRGLLSHVVTWGMILGFFGSVYLNWLFLTWLPGYLQIERGMDTIKSGFAAFFPFFFGFLGCLVAGALSDWLVRITGSAIKGRKYLAVVAMLGMAVFTVPAALVRDNTMALACISVVILLANIASTGSWALVSAVAPQQQVASLGALQNFGGYLGAALAPIVTGFVVDATGTFVPAMLIGAVIVTLSSLVYLFVVNKPIISATTS